MELNSDHLEFSMDKNKVIATGNVSISKDDVKILCDKLEYYRDNQIVIAEGNVVLIQKEGRFEGEKLKFNMGTMKGDFQATKIFSDPFFGVGEKITKIGENK